MRTRSLLVLGLSVLLGGASVLLARTWVMNAQPQDVVVEETPTATVVVASVPLHFGNRLAAENLKVVEWPADNRPAGTFAKIEDVLKENEERVVLRTIEPNEPIMESKISGFGGRATLSAIIEENMRAVTIRVNDVYGVAGFVLPGDRVDVMITREPEKGSPLTDILLQNVTVLGIDQQASEGADDPMVARSVTLQVSSVQAQKLTLASTVGTLSLALRNQLYTVAEKQKTVTLADLRVGEVNTEGGEPAVQPAPRAAPKDPGVAVRVVRGMAPTSQKVLPEVSNTARAPLPLRRAAPPTAPIQATQLPQRLLPMSW